MNELRTIMTVGFAATFWIVLMKLIFTRYYVPGVSEIYGTV
jgi:hypothetical protein